jgi:hypothetical protein
LYDSPKFGAAREPLALTRDELQRQLEAGAFALDKKEARKCGLVNPYDDETEKVLVREGKHQ